jgi:YspA, cpYpsA-related SLOG family
MLPMLAKVAGLLPTHTRRSEESQALQQFSTPIVLGLAASVAAAITPADLVLEPSAGTGLLAILAELSGGTLILNELAETRAGLLRHLFPDIVVGSMVNHRTLTSAMIDSRDFLAAKRQAENEVLLPAGPKIAVTGGFDFNDHRLIWDKLDKVHAKHSDMVLLHGGSPKGTERIAARWADHRKVPQIASDWTKHAKAAPFKRNDQMLEVLPIGVIVFPGSGISANLADKAKKLGIPVWKFGNGGA